MATITQTEAQTGPSPTRVELFTGFLLLGLMGFGGVLPLSRRLLVEDRKWLRPDEFTDFVGLCQFLPGGNIINLSVAVGMRFHGVTGAMASLIGLVSAPTLVVIGLGSIYAQFATNPFVQHLFFGLAATASGLVLALAWKIVAPLKDKWVGIGMFVVTTAAITVFKTPLLPTLLVLAPLSMWLARRYPT
jgi:chromate transporter